MAAPAGVLLDPWKSPSEAKQKLRVRLERARNYAESKLWSQFDRNYATAYNSRGRAGDVALTDDGANFDEGVYDGADTSAMTGVNYAMKNLRLIHAQLSSNPPATIPRPATSDPEDRRRARAADAILRYALRQYGLQETFDLSNLDCLIYGTGVIKTVWDPNAGEPIGYKRGRVICQGDISVSVVAAKKLLTDPDAEKQDKINWAFEECSISLDEALYKWPGKREVIEAWLAENSDSSGRGRSSSSSWRADDPDDKQESFTFYEYWERGLPSNAMLGRFGTCLPDGTTLDEVGPSPFSFSPPPTAFELTASRQAGRKPKRMPPTARLPYHFITDIDVPRRVWGRSALEFAAPQQELLNSLDTAMLENVQAHGVARLVLPDGWEMAADSITSSPIDVIKSVNKEGAVGEPKFIPPMQLPAEMPALRTQTKNGLDDSFGVNESMFGQQSRETSGFSMQYATNQGNMIRRRLFNKYVLQVESVYRAILDLVRKHWRDPRTIQVLGREKAFQVIDLRGADIDGGYDLVVEYGTSLSLDPMTRRQEILQLQPLFQQAGVPPRILLSMLKLGELDVVDDLVMMADDRQREIFEEMFATGVYIEPEMYEDHENMLAYALRYRMTSEFKYLRPEEKRMVIRHITDRRVAAAQEAKPPTPPGMGQVPGPAGQVQSVGTPAAPAVPTPQGAVTEPAAASA